MTRSAARNGSESARPRRPPAIGRWLLRRLCSPTYLETVEGDVEELYRTRVDRRGAARAGFRYLLDVVSLVGTRYTGGPRLDGPQPTRTPLKERIVDKPLQDLRYASRSLLQAPGFTAVVVLTLALGIGANSTIFSIINSVLLRPLPYPEPDRIVQLNQMSTRGIRDISAVSQSIFRGLRDDNTVFEQMAMYSNQTTTLTGVEQPVRLTGLSASPALFPLLRVEALHGRTFTTEEEQPGNDKVVLLSHRAWHRYFGADPGIVGERILLDDDPHIVVGIMPPGFEFPEPGIEYWVPMAIAEPQEQDLGGGVRARMEFVAPAIARLNDGVTPEQAAEVTTAYVVSYYEQERAAEQQADAQAASAGSEREERLATPGGEPPAAGEPPAGGQRMAQRSGPGAPTAGGGGPGAQRMTVGAGSPDDDQEPEQGMEVEVLQERMVGEARPSLLMLMGAVGFVLLIACANVANLVLARSAVRTRETAVRAALGAGGFQLVRLSLIEGLLLALVGGAIGLGMTFVSLRVVTASAAEFIPRAQEIDVDLWSLGFTLGVAALTGILFSLLPARKAVRLDLTRALKEGGGFQAMSKLVGRNPLRWLLVTGEIALSVVLLVGAGLLVASFVRLATVDPGWNPDNLLDLQLELPRSQYPTGASQMLLYDQLVDALSRTPGVDAVAVANQAPSFPARLRIAIRTERQEQEAPDEPPRPVGIRLVDDSYLATVGARIVEGRGFGPEDRSDTQPVAVVSRAGAEALFPGESAIGQEMTFFGSGQTEIVGVIDDFRQAGIDPEPQAELFILYDQVPDRLAMALGSTAHVLVRTTGSPLRLLPALRARVEELAPGIAASEVSTLRDMLAEEIAEPRFYASLVGSFAAVALALAAVGIYGVLSYSVQQRVQETAIRRALGAQPGQVLARVVRQGMLLAAIGLAAGLAGAVVLTRVLEAMLYEIEPTDPGTYAAVTAMFLLVALAAVFVPARRATRIDPMQALR